MEIQARDDEHPKKTDVAIDLSRYPDYLGPSTREIADLVIVQNFLGMPYTRHTIEGTEVLIGPNYNLGITTVLNGVPVSTDVTTANTDYFELEYHVTGTLRGQRINATLLRRPCCPKKSGEQRFEREDFSPINLEYKERR